MMKVGTLSLGPIETNIDPRLQEDEPVVRPMEELVEVQVDPVEPCRVLKIRKNLESGLADQLINFLKKNMDVFA